MIENLIENWYVILYVLFSQFMYYKLYRKHSNLLAELRGKHAYWIIVQSKIKVASDCYSKHILSDISSLIKNYE